VPAADVALYFKEHSWLIGVTCALLLRAPAAAPLRHGPALTGGAGQWSPGGRPESAAAPEPGASRGKET